MSITSSSRPPILRASYSTSFQLINHDTRRSPVPTRLVVVAAAKTGKSSSSQDPQDALARREQELWERQQRLMDISDQQHIQNFKTLQAMHDQLQAQHYAERQAWLQQEAALKQELSEARAQIMYAQRFYEDLIIRGVLPQQRDIPSSQLSSNNVGENFSLPPSGASGGQQQQASLPGNEIQALIDAAKNSSSSGDSSTTAQSQPTSSPAASYEQAFASTATTNTQQQQAEVPSYAEEFAAAFAAPDQVDVLSKDGIDFADIAKKIAEGRKTAAALAAAKEQQQKQPSSANNTSSSNSTQDNATSAAAIPQGPPPVLSLGADDIFWVNQLHTALVDSGYFPGEQDIDDYYFGESTQSALFTMQACEGLSETGVADEETWVVLLGPELKPVGTKDLTENLMTNMPGVGSSFFGGLASSSEEEQQGAGASPSSSSSSKPYHELFSASYAQEITTNPTTGQTESHTEYQVSDDVETTDGRLIHDEATITEDATINADGTVQRTGQVETGHSEVLTKWPTLMEGDGSRSVHGLHVALENHGYYAAQDETMWWSFGSTTVTALKTFQACAGLPESGVADARTWMALLGPDAVPNDILSLRSGGSDDEDLAFTGEKVWLIGEQRWEDKRRLD